MKEGTEQNKEVALEGTEQSENAAGAVDGKARVKRAQVKMCYQCGEYVPASAEECPKCGAGPSKFNPAWVLRVVIGFLIGFFIWLFFMN